MDITCQRHLFSIESDVHYLNCAAYSPLLTSSKQVGLDAIDIKTNPHNIKPHMHFDCIQRLREKLAAVVHVSDPDRIAVFPSVSYGMAIVANNLHRISDISEKKRILVLQDEFPNDVYAFVRVASILNLKIEAVPQPAEFNEMGERWNASILDAIDHDVALVVVPQVHWIYGVVFDLESISRKCKGCQCLLVVDGSQSIGAMPLDIEIIQPDAVVCAGYKWLFGPYSLSFGYFGEFFDDGVPIEESWMNRVHSENFSGVTTLQSQYRPKAQRYNMGEFSDFVNVAILDDSLSRVLEWGPERINQYVAKISAEPLSELRDIGCVVVSDMHRAPHLFGIHLPPSVDPALLQRHLADKRVWVSLRGTALRISLNVFNSEDDLRALVAVLRDTLVA